MFPGKAYSLKILGMVTPTRHGCWGRESQGLGETRGKGTGKMGPITWGKGALARVSSLGNGVIEAHRSRVVATFFKKHDTVQTRKIMYTVDRLPGAGGLLSGLSFGANL